MSSPRRPLGRRIAFALVATVLFFVAATAALAGLERAGLLDTFRQDDSVLFLEGTFLKADTAAGLYRIMDPQSPKVVQASFPLRKKRGTFRVFITGESFVRGGHHYAPGTPPPGYGTIPDWMQQLLEARYPSRRFEVVNAGANGQTSFRIVSVVDELVRADPDLLVVAMGNNEGLLGASGASELLHDWVLYRLLKKGLVPEPPKEERPAFQPQMGAPHDIRESFRANVEHMVAAAKARGVPVMLAPLPLNLLDIARTFSAEESRKVGEDPACFEARRLASQGACDAAAEAGTSCSQPFFVAVTTAQCLHRAGRYEEARGAYELAVEIEPRGRTRPSLNQILRDVAAEQGTLLADLDAGMRSRSANGIGGDRYFIDAVHLTCMGYLPVARDIVGSIVASGLVDAGWGEPKPDPPAAELLAAHPWDPLAGSPANPAMQDRTKRICSPDPKGE